MWQTPRQGRARHGYVTGTSTVLEGNLKQNEFTI